MNYKKKIKRKLKGNREMIVKEIEEYNIPDGYKSMILDFYEKTLKLLDSKLLLFLIGRKLWKRIGP